MEIIKAMRMAILICLIMWEWNVEAQTEGGGTGTAAPGAGGAPVTMDITDPKYGAAPGKDIAEALSCAWKEAINSTCPVKIRIPPGTWCLSQVKLIGPSLAPIDLIVEGTLQADSNPAALPNKECEWITINYVCNLTIYGGGVFDGQGQQAWNQNDCHKNQKCGKLPMNLSFNFVNNTVIRDVTTKDSKNFHVNCISSHNVTFQRFTISAPGDSPNTDGIHIGRSSMIKVLDSTIKTGDDCLSIGDEMCDLEIRNVSCGPGHGISIGSMGKYESEKDVNGIIVQNCSFNSTQNGVRIKTWPNAPATLTISNITFQDLLMENVSNPIIIDQEYCPHNLCDKSKPSQIKICNVKIKNVKGTSQTCEALTFLCSSGKPCENVEVSDIDLTYLNPIPANFTTRCENVKPILSGILNPPVCPPVQPA